MGKNIIECKNQSLEEGITFAEHRKRYHANDDKLFPKATAAISKPCRIATDEEMVAMFDNENWDKSA